MSGASLPPSWFVYSKNSHCFNASRRNLEILQGGIWSHLEEEPGDASRRNVEILQSLSAPAHPTGEWFFLLYLRSSLNFCWIPDFILRIPTHPYLGAAAQKGLVHLQCPQDKTSTSRVFFWNGCISAGILPQGLCDIFHGIPIPPEL